MDLIYELRKCKECSCSRCMLNGSKECFIEVAIKELDRYDQAMDSLKWAEENRVPKGVVLYANSCKEEN